MNDRLFCNIQSTVLEPFLWLLSARVRFLHRILQFIIELGIEFDVNKDQSLLSESSFFRESMMACSLRCWLLS